MLMGRMRKGENGAALVETAVVLPVFVLMRRCRALGVPIAGG